MSAEEEQFTAEQLYVQHKCARAHLDKLDYNIEVELFRLMASLIDKKEKILDAIAKKRFTISDIPPDSTPEYALSVFKSSVIKLLTQKQKLDDYTEALKLLDREMLSESKK